MTGMTYNNSYDVAAVMLCVSCIFYFLMSKRIRHFKHTLYAILCGCVLTGSLSNIFAGYFARIHHPVAANLAINTYFLVNVLTMCVFGLYVQCMNGYLMNRHKKYYLLYSIPAVLAALLIGANFFLHFLFYYDADCRYVRGEAFLLMHLLTVFYLVQTIYTIIRNAVFVQKQKIIYLLSGLGLVIAGIVVQMLFRQLQIQLFTEAVMLTLMSIVFENASLEVDPDLNIYKRKVFLDFYKTVCDLKSEMTLIAISLVNTEQLLSTLSSEEKAAAFRSVCEKLSKLVGHNNVYTYTTEKYAVMLERRNVRNYNIVENDFLIALEAMFNQSWSVGDKKVFFNALVTVIHLPEDAESVTLDSIFHRGRNLNFVDSNMILRDHKDVDILRKRTRMLNAVRRACENRSFLVYYQPIWSVDTRSVVSAEALVRMDDPELGFIPPDEFISAAEEYGLISDLGEIVLEKVCEFCATYHPEQYGIEWIELNVSPYQLGDANIVQKFAKILQKYNIPVSFINLELTETVDVFRNGIFEDTLRQLKDFGFTFSMDDYGTGYSNLANLMSNNYRTVKIDKSLLWKATDKEGMDFLMITVNQLKSIKLQVLQEGVETKEQLDIITAFGGNLIQGYYFSKPIPDREFIAYCKGRAVLP
ncbi:MAG: EAL domain-containing protein [Oscillospiraceae bacterium]|nr:EAL domain-containing protein [Oscillospiraceae bacterium]